MYSKTSFLAPFSTTAQKALKFALNIFFILYICLLFSQHFLLKTNNKSKLHDNYIELWGIMVSEKTLSQNQEMKAQ